MLSITDSISEWIDPCWPLHHPTADCPFLDDFPQSPWSSPQVPPSLSPAFWGYSGGGWGEAQAQAVVGPAVQQRDQENPRGSTLTGSVALRLSLHSTCATGAATTPPAIRGPTRQRAEKMAQRFALQGHSGTLGDGSESSGRASREWRGAAGPRGRGSLSCLRGAPGFGRPARLGLRTAARASPRGAVRARSPGTRLATKQPIRGYRRQPPRQLAAESQSARGGAFFCSLLRGPAGPASRAPPRGPLRPRRLSCGHPPTPKPRSGPPGGCQWRSRPLRAGRSWGQPRSRPLLTHPTGMGERTSCLKHSLRRG